MSALATGTTASATTTVGFEAGKVITTGTHNTAVGCQAGLAATTCTYNTFLGVESGKAMTTGSTNIAIGYQACDTATTVSNSIFIGTGTEDSSDGEYQIVLGNSITSAGNNTFSFGKASNVVTNTYTSDANWSRSSDKRLKIDIQDGKLGLDFINDLRTVSHKWKPSNEVPKELTRHYSEINNKDTDVKMYGFIAQEVKAAMDKHNEPKFTGWSESDDGSQNVSREMFVIPLIKAVQELSAEIEELKKWKEEHTCCG